MEIVTASVTVRLVDAGRGCGRLGRLEGEVGAKHLQVGAFGSCLRLLRTMIQAEGDYRCAPLYTLLFDHAGSLYGMAQGGDRNCGPCGVIFKLAPQKSGKWKYSVVHSFHGADGNGPSGVVLDSKGHIFGATAVGGKYGSGVAFEITP